MKKPVEFTNLQITRILYVVIATQAVLAVSVLLQWLRAV